DRLESPMRMVRCSLGLPRGQVRGTHLVEQQEGIEVVEVRCRERAVNQEAGALESFDRRHHVANRSDGHEQLPPLVRPLRGKSSQTGKISKAALGLRRLRTEDECSSATSAWALRSSARLFPTRGFS